MIQLEPKLKVKSGPLEVIPVLSLLFILLVFLLVSTSLVFQQGVKADLLPEVKAAELQMSDKLVIALVIQDGEAHVFFNSRPCSWQQLDQRLSEAVQQHTRLQEDGQQRRPVISVRAAKNVDYGDVMKVIDLALRMQVEVILVSAGKKVVLPKKNLADKVDRP